MKPLKQLLTLISPRLNIRLTYWRYHGYCPNLERPRTLDEKIQWMKLHLLGKQPIYTHCADKYTVRSYVAERGLEHLLTPLIDVFERPEDIKWEALPDKFALKYNFGNGMNIICQDKAQLNKKRTLRRLQQWYRRKPHLTYAEFQYKDIPRKLLLEQFIEPEQGHPLPTDYKFFCFNGKPYCCMICTNRGRGSTQFQYIDRELRPLIIEKGQQNTLSLKGEEAHIEQMFRYAELLSEEFPFVRVDFYLSQGKIYFGELTFSPAAGHDRERLPEQDLFLGSLLKLPTIDNLSNNHEQ